jgi:hypothetical protein
VNRLTGSGLAEQLAGATSSTVSVLSEGEYPAFALAEQGRHLVLLRDHGHSVAVSIPGAWMAAVREAAELPPLVAKLEQALADFRREYPNAVSLADAIVSLAPLVERCGGERPRVDFPGTPAPSEAWLRAGSNVVGLFQEDAAVRVVMWIAGKHHDRLVKSPAGLAGLVAWTEPLLAQQKERGAEPPPPPPPSGPPPTFAELLGILRAGLTIQTGGGRYFEKYYLEGSQIRRYVFDEGWEGTSTMTETELAEELARYPESFRRALER